MGNSRGHFWTRMTWSVDRWKDDKSSKTFAPGGSRANWCPTISKRNKTCAIHRVHTPLLWFIITSADGDGNITMIDWRKKSKFCHSAKPSGQNRPVTLACGTSYKKLSRSSRNFLVSQSHCVPQSESVKWISIVCLRYNFNVNIQIALSRELQPVVTLGTLVPAVCGSVFLDKPHSPESQGHRRPIKFRKLALAGVLWLLSSFVLLLLLFVSVCLFISVVVVVVLGRLSRKL